MTQVGALTREPMATARDGHTVAGVGAFGADTRAMCTVHALISAVALHRATQNVGAGAVCLAAGGLPHWSLVPAESQLAIVRKNEQLR